jgi:hypothetical protein
MLGGAARVFMGVDLQRSGTDKDDGNHGQAKAHGDRIQLLVQQRHGKQHA